MAEHAKLSPSSAVMWMICAGALPLSEGMPEQSSPYAAEGTLAHSLAEWKLKNRKGQFPWPPSMTAAQRKEMEDYVQIYVDHLFELDRSIKGAESHVEKKVSITEHCWGTADAIIWDPITRTLYVRDLKYGAGVAVSVRENLQLKIYALAALLTMKYPAKLINIGIVQPRMPHEDGLIRSVDYASADLLDFYAEIQDAAGRVRDAFYFKEEMSDRAWADEFLQTSEKGCRWCLAAPKCPKLKAQAQEVCKQAFAVEKADGAPTTSLAYEPAELSHVLDQVPLIEAYCKNVREFAYQEAEQGRVPPGYKLVEKRATRRWKDDVNHMILATKLGPDVKFTEVLKAPELRAVGEILKMCPGKNAAEREAVLEPFTVKESSGHTLVHESDKREPVRLDAKAAFSTLSTQEPS